MKSSFIGGVSGLFVFLVVGLLPSLVYGGYAGVVLANAMFSGPIHQNIISQIIVVFGIVVGVLSVAGLFTLFGAIVGAGTSQILHFNKKNKKGSCDV